MYLLLEEHFLFILSLYRNSRQNANSAYIEKPWTKL